MSILHEFDFVSLFKITLRTLLLKPGLYLELHDGYLMLYWNCLSFQGTWVHPPHGLRVARSLVFCLMFCRSFCHFVPFLLAIVLSVLLFKNSDRILLISSNSSLVIFWCIVIHLDCDYTSLFIKMKYITHMTSEDPRPFTIRLFYEYEPLV